MSVPCDIAGAGIDSDGSCALDSVSRPASCVLNVEPTGPCCCRLRMGHLACPWSPIPWPAGPAHISLANKWTRSSSLGPPRLTPDRLAQAKLDLHARIPGQLLHTSERVIFTAWHRGRRDDLQTLRASPRLFIQGVLAEAA